MTPLERAANAIEHEFVELADPYGNVSAYGIAHRVARAVLAAIREPSEGVVDALNAGLEGECLWRHPDGSAGSPQDHAWQSMLDAALAEEG